MTTWHAPEAVLNRYAARPETLDELTALSLEAHLLSCAQCRAGVAAAADPSFVAASWDEVADEIDRSRWTLAERVLGLFVPDHLARVVAATPALRLSWLCAVVTIVAAAVLLAREVGTSTPFLALAPLIPLAGVGLSFAAVADPAGEVALSTPLFGTGLLLRRAATVLAMAIVVLSLGTLALPEYELRHVGWLLPALALTFGALALATWFAPMTATAVAGASWVLVVEAAAFGFTSGASFADSGLFSAVGQLVFAGCAVLGAIAFALRGAAPRSVEVR